MSLLDQVQQSGNTVISKRIVIVAAEKMGKTTFCTGAPSALLVPAEQGYDGLVGIEHTPMVKAWTDMQTLQRDITQRAQRGGFKYKSLVFDSATALETLIHTHVLALDKGAKSMEAAHGGYGKAYGIANSVFKEWLSWCDDLAIHGGINIVITAHAFSAKIKDPMVGEYDSWDILLHSPKNQKDYGKREIITQWADVIGYLHEPMIVTQTNGVSQGISRGQGRVLAIERTPAYVAGNRYGIRGAPLALPAPPANAWNVFADALYKATANRVDLYTRERP